jgi:hypothetical protein
MIKVLTAYTCELDDSEKAAEEILGQLALSENRLKNSVALLFCHVEFINQGIMQTVCEKLPFDVLGCSSQFFALPGAADEMLLSVAVLTSNDVEFATGLTDQGLNENNVSSCIEDAYKKTAAILGNEPSLIFAIQPLLFHLSGDVITSALDVACGGLPIFGTCAVDADVKLRNPKTIYRGEAFTNRLALLLLKGPVRPRFFSALFPEKSVFPQDAVITCAKDNQIISINNVPAVLFMENLGIIQRNISSVLYAIPLTVDYPDDKEPSSSEVVIISDIGEGGTLICSRNIQTGGSLNIGSISEAYVLETASAISQSIKKAGGGEGLFMFSCFSRTVTLGGDPLGELKVIQRELKDFSVPYLFLYSGGEICPRKTEHGRSINHFHQYALVACLL